MSAAVIALTRWEPCIALDAIDVVWKAGGRAGDVVGTCHADHAEC